MACLRGDTRGCPFKYCRPRFIDKKHSSQIKLDKIKQEPKYCGDFKTQTRQSAGAEVALAPPPAYRWCWPPPPPKKKGFAETTAPLRIWGNAFPRCRLPRGCYLYRQLIQRITEQSHLFHSVLEQTASVSHPPRTCSREEPDSVWF